MFGKQKTSRQLESASQYNTIQFRVEMPVNCGKEQENKQVLSLVLNVHKHFERITPDSRLFQVLAATMGNAWSPIVNRCVGGRASAEVDDKHRHCRPGSPVIQRQPGRPAQVCEHTGGPARLKY